MAKKDVIKKEEDVFDDEIYFDDDMGCDHHHHHDEMSDMVGSLLEAGQNQQYVALELTKLVVGKSAAEKMGEKDIYEIFQRATTVVNENFSLKEFLEK